MKTFVILSALVILAAAAPPAEEPIAIVSQNADANADGSYVFSYETANGIRAEANGEVRKNPNPPLTKDAEGSEDIVVSRGSFSYTAPDGTPFTLTYVADENGFQPQGEHLPVAPPIPPAIQRALDFLASQNKERK